MKRSDLRALPARSSDPSRRLRALETYIARRSAFCLCGVLARYQVDRDTTGRLIRDALRSGRIHVAPGSIRGEPIYVATTETSGKLVPELLEAARQVEFAVGVLEQSFSEYRRGKSLADLGAAGLRIKETLKAGVVALSCAKLIPSYWVTERYNPTAVVLAFSYVFTSRAAVVAFLAEVQALPTRREWALPIVAMHELAEFVGYTSHPGGESARGSQRLAPNEEISSPPSVTEHGSELAAS